VSWVVVTETNAPWFAWAGKDQFLLWPFAAQVAMQNGITLDGAATKLEQAAKLAGAGGAVILSVGHGGLASTGDGRTDEGFFDLAPSGFRVAGANAVLTGQTGSGKAAQVSVFYDRVPTFSGGVIAKSPKQEDEARAQSSNPNVSGPARTRLAHWDRYLKIGEAFKNNGVGALILLTCKVGLATDFLKRARTQLGVPIGAYKRRVVGNTVDYFLGPQLVASRTRIFLEGDADGTGTNVEWGEFWIPMPPLSQWTVIP
jgi:hypothetical protein